MSKVNEEWRDVIGYEGLYQVSNLGRVRSLDRTNIIRNRWGGVTERKHSGRLMSQQKYTNGYMFVALSSNGKVSCHLVHRIVAAAFIGMCDMEVNHKDGNKKNNAVNNLEYMTHSENQKHSYRVLKNPPVRSWLGKRGFEHNKSIHVKVVDIETGIEQIFGSYRLAQEGGFCRSTIKECIDKDKLFKNRYKFEKI